MGQFTQYHSMQSTMKRLVALLLIVCCSQMVFTQQTIKTETNIKGKILNNNTGFLLVKTAKEMFAIGPDDQKVTWRNEALKKISLESYREIPFTPLVIFESKPLVSSNLLSKALNTKGVSRTILNVTNGKVLFNSEEVGFKAVYNTLLIPGQEAVLVDGLKDKKWVIGLYNFRDGNQIWEKDLTNSGFFNSVKGALLQKEKILLDRQDNIFWLKNNHFLKLDKSSGKTLFEQESVQSITLSPNKDVLFLFTNKVELKKADQETAITALNAASMKPLWENPILVLGNIVDTATEDEKMVVITSKGFNVIDRSGRKQWEQSEILPLIKKIVPISNGYLVVQEKFLILIDDKGGKVWEEPVTISLSSEEAPVHIFTKGDGALYITPSKANKLSIASGEKVGEDVILNDASFVTRSLKLKEHPFSVWFDEKRQQFPVYSQNKFYVFSGSPASNLEATHTFNFKSGVPDLSIGDKGYFMHHNNKFYFFDFEGSLIYQKEYPVNDQTTFFNKAVGSVKKGIGTYTAAVGFAGKQLGQTFKSVLVSQDVGFLSNAVSGIYGTYRSYSGSFSKATKINGIDFSSSLVNVFSRYKKGQQNDDTVLVVVPKEDVGFVVIRLHKDSGKEDEMMIIDQKEIDFLVDQIENKIYIFDKKEIRVAYLQN